MDLGRVKSCHMEASRPSFAMLFALTIKLLAKSQYSVYMLLSS